MDIGLNGHHGQNVRDPAESGIWSVIEVALILHHNMAAWIV